MGGPDDSHIKFCSARSSMLWTIAAFLDTNISRLLDLRLMKDPIFKAMKKQRIQFSAAAEDNIVETRMGLHKRRAAIVRLGASEITYTKASNEQWNFLVVFTRTHLISEALA